VRWNRATVAVTRSSVEELNERLTPEGVTYSRESLNIAITRLVDCGQIVRVQQQPYSVYPQYLVLSGTHPYDHIDVLVADVCSAIKAHGERFESEDQLRSWLDEDKITYDSGGLAIALSHLELVGRLRRPRADQWRDDQPLPGLYVEPRIFNE
jgi:hypothetical protein